MKTKMLISQPNLPWLFRLKAVSPANFETNCQKVQIAQVTFQKQVVCVLCSAKPQTVHTHMGIIRRAFPPQNWYMMTVNLLRRLNLGKLVLINILREKKDHCGLTTINEDQWNWQRGCLYCWLMLVSLVLRRANKKISDDMYLFYFRKQHPSPKYCKNNLCCERSKHLHKQWDLNVLESVNRLCFKWKIVFSAEMELQLSFAQGELK